MPRACRSAASAAEETCLEDALLFAYAGHDAMPATLVSWPVREKGEFLWELRAVVAESWPAFIFYIVYSYAVIQYTVYSIQYTVYSIQYTVYSIQYPVCSIQYIVCSIVYSI